MARADAGCHALAPAPETSSPGAAALRRMEHGIGSLAAMV